MFLIAGPCAIESRDMVMYTAETLKQVCDRLGITLYFKSSYDKANRTNLSERGVGMEKGLEILQEVKSTFSLPILTFHFNVYTCICFCFLPTYSTICNMAFLSSIIAILKYLLII